MIKQDPSTYTYVYKTPEGKIEILRRYDEILKQWPISYEELRLNTSYGDTYVLRSGDTTAPPLLLLHGASSNASLWAHDMEIYSRHYCVYAIDIPGEPGKSEERQYPLDRNVYSSWLKELLDNLGLSKVSLLGLSLGAWLATGFTTRYPERVKKLVLLCPSGIGRQRISFAFKALFYLFQGDKGYDKLTNLVNDGQPVPEETKTYTKLISKEYHLRSGQVPVYLDEELLKIQMPLLLCVGEQDALLDSKTTANRIRKLLPHAVVNLLPDHGHLLIDLQPQILSFLTGE